MGQFYRNPIIGGDDNTWGPFALALWKDSLGVNSCELYNSSGSLKISDGLIGIYDGTNIGIVEIDDSVIDLSSISINTWAMIELSVSGTSYTITATDAADFNGRNSIPDSIKNAYSQAKNGYYVSSTKRLIGIAYKDNSGNLALIYNSKSNNIGFDEVEIVNLRDSSGDLTRIYIRKLIFEIGSWDMDADISKTFSLNLSSSEVRKVKSIKVAILRDDGIYQMNSDATFVETGISWTVDVGVRSLTNSGLTLSRRQGSDFDSTDFNDTSINRGYVTIELEV